MGRQCADLPLGTTRGAASAPAPAGCRRRRARRETTSCDASRLRQYIEETERKKRGWVGGGGDWRVTVKITVTITMAVTITVTMTFNNSVSHNDNHNNNVSHNNSVSHSRPGPCPGCPSPACAEEPTASKWSTSSRSTARNTHVTIAAWGSTAAPPVDDRIASGGTLRINASIACGPPSPCPPCDCPPPEAREERMAPMASVSTPCTVIPGCVRGRRICYQ